ncbi:hypothetical protein MPDQ_005091 [Monascus purpureus]|uniref:ER membrane protein complex subunit 2 n=1 Tax=Monascus purpureus TaxID=5098 RepID=A0A507QGG8_MONPU|nr:hypothetical protein MPDQ_005091 [Monascus purpureus]
MGNTHKLHDAIHSSDFTSTLQFSQQTPSILGSRLTSETSPLALLTSASDNPEHYKTIEQLFLTCLQTGDDKSAQLCLDQLTKRFGPRNERVMGFRGLYEEATTEDTTSLEKCLHEYEKILSENPVNVPILKRRVALLRSMSKPIDAISALVEFLEAVPTDAEAWCELADLYQSQGMSSQAIFCLEESLLITPNSWNIHAHLGELLYVCASSATEDTSFGLLARSLRSFCRSIELCDDYLRGFYGLVLVSSLLLKNQNYARGPQDCKDGKCDSIPSKEYLQKLNLFSLKVLQSIVNSRSSRYQEWEYGQIELAAAKRLLDRFQTE